MRYVVGIDLGTTNSAVAYADTHDGEAARPVLFEIAQLTAPATVEERRLLPSFLYLPGEEERGSEGFALPWERSPRHVAGELARRRGAEVPARLVASAKSWLCHAGVDRDAPILPWNAPPEVDRLSPVAVSARYLAHVRAAWNVRFPGEPLERQEILLTVPASFDAAARELTVRAAREAGLPELTLLEEPQAAFYAWIDASGEAWRERVHPGDVALVCDVGGGTTDFTLIVVEEEQGSLALRRIAVGDHILLGGDNMDLALAYQVRERLASSGTQLDAWQFRALVQSCRDAKEKLLGDPKALRHPLALGGRGRKLVGGTVRADIERAEVERLLVDGFLPRCGLGERPQQPSRVALQEIGLPYSADPAITRHLAQFLARQHAGGGGPQAHSPTAILFNGGVMRAPALRERLLSVLQDWFPGRGELRVLAGADPECAVALGAAYYGLARRGRGVRIRGGTARSYYVGIESAMPAVPGMRPPLKALCVVPRGVEEGSDIALPETEFGLVVGEPAEFRLLHSASRPDDRVGDVVESWGEEIQESSPLCVTLESAGNEGTTVPVRLEARITEVGVLELWCAARQGGQRWKLEFSTRMKDESVG